MILLPDDRILISGDALSVNYHPNLEDADIPAWLDLLGEIKAMNVDQIIPGHGSISSRGHVNVFVNYLKKFDSEVRKRAMALIKSQQWRAARIGT